MTTSNGKHGGYWTQEQLLNSLKEKGLDVNDQPLKDTYINSSCFNLTKTFMETHSEVPRNLTGIIYKRFRGLVFGETLTPAVYDDGTPQLTLEGNPKTYISSKKFCSIFPKTIKGNKVKLKASSMKKLKITGIMQLTKKMINS